MKAIATLAAAAGLVTVGLMAGNHASPSQLLQGTLQEQHEFLTYVATFGRSYQSAQEMKTRFAIFRSNLDYINTENAKGHTYTLGVNQFSDWTKEEYKGMLGTKVPAGVTAPAHKVASQVESSPIDWRTKHNSAGDLIMPTIQNQGQCGSCYSFAASGTLSTAAMIKGCWTTSYHISEQWVVDCDTNDNGCNGGWESNVWWYIYDNGGILEADYEAYTAKQGSCSVSSNAKKYFQSELNIPNLESGKASFFELIAMHPLAIAIDAECNKFMQYNGGLLSDDSGECQGQIDHAVMLVGWANDSQCTGGKYAILRNSWGTGWGEKGYARVCFGNWANGNLMMFEYLMSVSVDKC